MKKNRKSFKILTLFSAIVFFLFTIAPCLLAGQPNPIPPKAPTSKPTIMADAGAAGSGGSGAAGAAGAGAGASKGLSSSTLWLIVGVAAIAIIAAAASGGGGGDGGTPSNH
jgi:preprotein translocase subunit SecG